MPAEYKEQYSSQIPAVRLLCNLGWRVMTAEEALAQRGGRLGGVLLEGILTDWLRTHNAITYKGKSYPFSDGNINEAVQALKSVLYDGLVRTNEKVYDLICLPKSLKQTIEGDTRSFDLHYIDWKRPERNVYHLVEEFAIERAGRPDDPDREREEEDLELPEGEIVARKRENCRRPDIVLFINGIPLAVIECKRPDLEGAVDQAISQQLRNQRPSEIPALFQYAQLLMAVAGNGAKFATVGTPKKFWAVWKEKGWADADEATLCELVNTEPEEGDSARLFSHRDPEMREYFAAYGERKPTAQDRAIYGLCRPERLLELIYQFIVFDAGEKKIARYQQYFCIKRTMARLKERDPETGGRRGGVIWHTQGSGKSLTMVMLAKAIALDPAIRNPRIMLVTDRVDLDDQIYGTFRACGMEPVKAESGAHLTELLAGDKTSIITTIIDKFETVAGKRNYRNTDENIFVLVDESHRSHHGRVRNSLFGDRARKMHQVLPRACYLGFTGTPLMKQDKNTARLFGGLIDSYPIALAVEDKAVVPLLYEGRDVDLRVDRDAIDTWFERVTQNLSREQKADLKKKFATTGQLNKAEQKVRCIAWDVATHYHDTWQGTGFKGQLVTPDKDTAIRYKEFLDETGMVTSEILISGPDTRKDHEEVEGEETERVQTFWKRMMDRYGTEEAYNKGVITAFKQAEQPEIIIVVSKLLTGFDAPRNTVLYLTKKLEGHTLLQAIARVNRLFEGKDFGYILDYVGVLGKLDEAMDLYGSFEGFDKKDLEETLGEITDYISNLPQKHSDLWELFKGVRNKKDQEAFEEALADEALRMEFYKRLSDFARTLQIALSSIKFSENTPAKLIERYRGDLRFFENLRRSVRQRYAEEIDFKEYEKRIRALVDRHVGATNVQQIVPLVSIFDEDAFRKEVEKITSSRSKADAIAHRTAKTIRERWDEDPAFYKKFSEMLQQVIDEFRSGRLSDAEYLTSVSQVMKSVIDRSGDSTPDALRSHEVARAFYGVIQEILTGRLGSEEEMTKFGVDASRGIEERILALRIINWTSNDDVINQMKIAIEELILDELADRYGVQIEFDDLDLLMEKCINIAKVRLPYGDTIDKKV